MQSDQVSTESTATAGFEYVLDRPRVASDAIQRRAVAVEKVAGALAVNPDRGAQGPLAPRPPGTLLRFRTAPGLCYD